MAGATDAGLGLPLRGRALAHHVDGGRRVACARGQARRAAHYFDAVVDDGVGVGLHVAESVEHPVNLEVADAIASGGVVDTIGVVMLNVDARGLAQHIRQGIEIEVVHLLACDHRDRLRGFLDGEVQPRGGAHRASSVGAGVLGGGAQAVGADGGRAQFQGFGGGCIGGGVGPRIRAQRQAEQAEGEGHGTGEGRKHRCRLLVVFDTSPGGEGLVQRRKELRNFRLKRE